MPMKFTSEAQRRAYQMGWRDGQTETQAKADLVQQATDDQFAVQTTSQMRACIAAVLEAVSLRTTNELLTNDDKGNIVIEVALNLDTQATIWDRWEYDTERHSTNNKLILITMTRKGGL